MLIIQLAVLNSLIHFQHDLENLFCYILWEFAIGHIGSWISTIDGKSDNNNYNKNIWYFNMATTYEWFWNILAEKAR